MPCNVNLGFVFNRIPPWAVDHWGCRGTILQIHQSDQAGNVERRGELQIVPQLLSIGHFLKHLKDLEVQIPNFDV